MYFKHDPKFQSLSPQPAVTQFPVYLNETRQPKQQFKMANPRMQHIAIQVATLLSVNGPFVEEAEAEAEADADDKPEPITAVDDNGIQIVVAKDKQKIIVEYYTFRIYFKPGKIYVAEYISYENETSVKQPAPSATSCVAQILEAWQTAQTIN